MEIGHIVVEAAKKAAEGLKKVSEASEKVNKVKNDVKKITDEKDDSYLTNQVKNEAKVKITSALSEGLNDYFSQKIGDAPEVSPAEHNHENVLESNDKPTKEGSSLVEGIRNYFEGKRGDTVMAEEQKTLPEIKSHEQLHSTVEPQETSFFGENPRLHILNKGLEGKVHPDTGVPFEKKIVLMDGKEVEVVIPVFESKFEAQLPEELLKAKDSIQFKECSQQLLEAIQNNPDLALQFDETQFEQILALEKPDGYTWHHDYEVGKMQLVDTVIHNKTAHIGGKAIWGGGKFNR